MRSEGTPVPTPRFSESPHSSGCPEVLSTVEAECRDARCSCCSVRRLRCAPPSHRGGIPPANDARARPSRRRANLGLRATRRTPRPDYRPFAVCGAPNPEPSSPTRRTPGADRREISTRVLFVADHPRRVMGKAKQPASHAEAVGWRLKIFGPPSVRLSAASSWRSTHSAATTPSDGTRRTTDGTGLTEVNLAEGAVTWTVSPDGVAVGGKRSTPTNKKPKVPSTETLEEVEKRVGKNTIKGICFAVLKNAGPQGMLLAEIVAETQEAGPEGLERCSAAEQHGERVLFRRCRVCQGGAGPRGARVPRCARVPGSGGARRTRARRESAVLRGVREWSVQHQGDAHAHQPVVRVRTRETLSNTRGKYREP